MDNFEAGSTKRKTNRKLGLTLALIALVFFLGVVFRINVFGI